MKLISGILNLFFPPRCTFCDRLLWKGDGDDSRACHVCRDTLPFASGDSGITEGDYFVSCVSPFFYRDNVRKAVLRMKFGPSEALCLPLGHYIADCIKEHPEIQFDSISWIPLSRRRRSSRGFDQAEVIARQVALDLNLPLLQLLEKHKNPAAQSSMKGKDARKANIKDAYRLLKGADVADKRVLLIDDVITTGSTLSECARVLVLGGAERVYGATFAKTPQD